MARIEDRLDRLERRLRPSGRQSRAIGDASRRIIAAIDWLAAGGAPWSEVEHALVRNELDPVAAIEALLEARRDRRAR